MSDPAPPRPEELDVILQRAFEECRRRSPELGPDPVAEERARWIADAARIGVPLRLLRATLELAKETPALDAARRWLEADYAAGRCLVLSGPTGVGKSFAATMTLRWRPEAGRRYAYFPGGCSALLDPERRAAMLDGLTQTPFVVLDDFGSEYLKAGGLLEAFVDEIVWHREANCLPTILTTNLDAVTLKGRLSERIVDRLNGEWGRIYEIGGPSLRDSVRTGR